jgi:hypothetical protein
MVNTLELLDILKEAQIEEPKARAVVRALERQEASMQAEVVAKELSLRVYLDKNMMTKLDGEQIRKEIAQMETTMTTKFYVALFSAAFAHAALVMTAVYVIVKLKP